jgi:hypothetical protein
MSSWILRDSSVAMKMDSSSEPPHTQCIEADSCAWKATDGVDRGADHNYPTRHWHPDEGRDEVLSGQPGGRAHSFIGRIGSQHLDRGR